MAVRKRPLVSLAEAARLLGKHRNTVAGWLADGCPSVRSASREEGVEWALDLRDVVAWLCERAARAGRAEVERVRQRYEREVMRLREALGLVREGQIDTLEEARRRRAIAEAHLAELELGRRKGELLARDEVTSAWVSVASAIRNQLLALPTRLAPELAAEARASTVNKRLDAAIRETLELLADARLETNGRV